MSVAKVGIQPDVCSEGDRVQEAVVKVDHQRQVCRAAAWHRERDAEDRLFPDAEQRKRRSCDRGRAWQYLALDDKFVYRGVDHHALIKCQVSEHRVRHGLER